MTRPPCCGYNLARRLELKGEYSWSCSHKIESVSYDHWLTNKAYLSAIAVTSIFQSFCLQAGGENRPAERRNDTTSLLSLYYWFFQQQVGTSRQPDSGMLWPRGLIIRPRPQLRPHSFWPRPNRNWPRSLEYLQCT